MTEHPNWFHRRGTIGRDGWESVVDDSTPGWSHTGIRIGVLEEGETLALADTGMERIIVPLSGSFSVQHTEAGTVAKTALAGRNSVFDGPSDVLYLSCAASAIITGTGRVAVASAPASAVHPTRHILARETPIELRGAGASSRQVHNFGTPEALEAERLIVCEVITPAENWSSYPPHKHDEHVPGRESRLEEIYYFEAAPTSSGSGAAVADAAFGMFATYSSGAGEIDVAERVHTGDVALVPFGYHGPAIAAPGYDLYYLNVMAGPDRERAWLITDDPAHAWVRDSWSGQDMDPRLPYRAEGDR
ncbi:5-deoxy-glucuronate isomerase [Microbacterium oxydans]|uniref:5-deoxy-glucuronate isomerase n=1 Tax=Microbacterium oxydans TaxID=82380 RepID=UPI0024AE4C67|nr:5-deoxy-glucuronate isomerase [Microbacterium oxydans]